MLALLASGIISVALMHDWLAWNSARWELGREAVLQRGIRPDEIEGGFEWDGWYASEDPQNPQANPDRKHSANEVPGLNLLLSRFYFPSVCGRYAISFSKLPASKSITTKSYQVWLPPVCREMLLLRYQPEPE